MTSLLEWRPYYEESGDPDRGSVTKVTTDPLAQAGSRDNVRLAWADRTRMLPEPYRKKVIKMNGDVAQTFLVDRFVAGMWTAEEGRVVFEPFARLSRSVQSESKARPRA